VGVNSLSVFNILLHDFSQAHDLWTTKFDQNQSSCSKTGVKHFAVLSVVMYQDCPVWLGRALERLTLKTVMTSGLVLGSNRWVAWPPV